MLDKTYRPAEVEAKHYDAWEKSGAFAADPASNAQPYTIMMPPPNVTGSLHMGHALTITLQDMLIRFTACAAATRCGSRAPTMPASPPRWWSSGSWPPTARPATTSAARPSSTGSGSGRPSRAARSPASCAGWAPRRTGPASASPWTRACPRRSRKVFVTLYKQGLIYRDKRLVNWDPKLQTAISDLEVEQREVKGHLWHFRYPLEGEPDQFITVATTRPETMLGDTAVAVHPDDERYKDLIGKLCRSCRWSAAASRSSPTTTPIRRRARGAVKITPAHDFNDFEVGRRHELEMINVLDRDAQINDDATPEAYRGLDRFEARKRIVADLEALGLVEKIEPHTPHACRTATAPAWSSSRC